MMVHLALWYYNYMEEHVTRVDMQVKKQIKLQGRCYKKHQNIEAIF